MSFIAYIKLLILSLVQDSIIFKPNLSDVGKIKHPLEYHLPETNNISLETEDFERINLWVKQPENEDGIVFVVFHGNTGHLGNVGTPSKDDIFEPEYRVNLLKEIIKTGNGFVAVSLRGYGASSGKPSEAGFEKDVKAIAKFLENENYPNLIILSESLGNNTALKLNEALNYKNVQKIALIASFTDLFDKSTDLYPEFAEFDLSKILRHKFDNKKILQETKYQGKILLFHPIDDETTPFKHSEKLFEIAKEKGLDVYLYPLKNCGHITWNPQEIIDIILEK
ncbi:MAG: hypothetical protein SFT90_03700 [Rickettsiales bacterium]|nr:hypothetical protein [Rickettsiales bacterium]